MIDLNIHSGMDNNIFPLVMST